MAEPDEVHDWDASYGAEAAPWDIGRPQDAFQRLAEAGALSGAVVDAGCGTGEHTLLAAATATSALGVDIAPRAIERARRKAAERGVEARFEVLDARRLTTLGTAVQTILDSGLFHVFDDTDRVRYVTSLADVLAPGGHLHLMCFSDRQPGDWGPRRVTEAELRAAFGAGWRVASLRRDHFEINPVSGITRVEAWLADVVRTPR